MADSKKVVLTYEGLRKLEEELENLKTVKRKEVAEKIKEARGQGDLSENAEYDAAKEEQGDDEVSDDIVTVGSRVKIWDAEFEEEIEYSIVGSAEADPMNSENGKISNESPVGRGLLGHKIGDVVAIETPGGIVEFKILAISR